MTPDRKKPGVAFWTTVVAVVALVAYPLGFGPACWISSRTGRGAGMVSSIYGPMMHAASGRKAAVAALHGYSRLGAANGWQWAGYGPERPGAFYWVFVPRPRVRATFVAIPDVPAS